MIHPQSTTDDGYRCCVECWRWNRHWCHVLRLYIPSTGCSWRRFSCHAILHLRHSTSPAEEWVDHLLYCRHWPVQYSARGTSHIIVVGWKLTGFLSILQWSFCTFYIPPNVAFIGRHLSDWWEAGREWPRRIVGGMDPVVPTWGTEKRDFC